MKTSASGGSLRASHHACQVLLAKHFARQASRVSAGSALTCFVRCRVWQMQPQANHECQTTRVFSSLALHQTRKKLLQLAPFILDMCLSRIPAYGPDAQTCAPSTTYLSQMKTLRRTNTGSPHSRYGTQAYHFAVLQSWQVLGIQPLPDFRDVSDGLQGLGVHASCARL